MSKTVFDLISELTILGNTFGDAVDHCRRLGIERSTLDGIEDMADRWKSEAKRLTAEQADALHRHGPAPVTDADRPPV